MFTLLSSLFSVRVQFHGSVPGSLFNVRAFAERTRTFNTKSGTQHLNEEPTTEQRN
jgi:hypothetical protein